MSEHTVSTIVRSGSPGRPPAPLPPRDARWMRSVGVATLLVLAAVCGALVAAALAWSGPRHTAGATVLVTGVTGEGRGSPYAVGQYGIDRAPTWATVAESRGVAAESAARLGLPAPALEGQVQAEAPTGLSMVRIVVEAPDPDAAVRWAEVVATVATEQINLGEQVPAVPTPRVRAAVIDVDRAAEDAGWREVRFVAVPGGVIALLIAWTVISIRRPGGWIGSLNRPLGGVARHEEVRRVDQAVQIEVLGAMLLGQSWKGLAVAGLALFGTFGYALTGSVLPPLLVVLLAGIGGIRDLRLAAGGILFAAVTVLPGRIEVVDLGVLTPSVLEIAVAIGVLLTIWHARRDRPVRGIFTGPVLAILGALAAGCAVALTSGVDPADVIPAARTILTLLAFFVVRAAFRGRPTELLGVLLVTAAASAVVALAGLGLGFETLDSAGVDYVVTGGETADVFRVNTPVIELWGPLLIVLAAGVIRLRPRWLWAVLLVPCLALQGLSFDRTTWATLLVLAVVVGVLRGGRAGLVRRAGALVVVGAVSLGALSAGLLGAEGQAVAQRLTSVITAQAFAEDSLADRLRENEAARETLAESPLVGTGVGAYYGSELVTYDDTMGVLDPAPRPWIHNQYYRVWLWMGVLGLVAYGALAVRLTALSYHAWLRRGAGATVPVAATAGLASIAAQALFATSLDFPPTIITVAVTLALIELSVTEPDATIPNQRGGRSSDRAVPGRPGMKAWLP